MLPKIYTFITVPYLVECFCPRILIFRGIQDNQYMNINIHVGMRLYACKTNKGLILWGKNIVIDMSKRYTSNFKIVGKNPFWEDVVEMCNINNKDMIKLVWK